ncbi:MAG TPA: glutamate dehydrogenase, partial [Telluria sp.]
MNDSQADLRGRLMSMVKTGFAQAPGDPVGAMAGKWLDLLDDEDLRVLAPDVFVSLLCEGCAHAATRQKGQCQVIPLRYASGKGSLSLALLIVNDDMPYLVDSILMAMRRQSVAVDAVMNAVFARERGAPESFVLCLLSEELPAAGLARLMDRIEMVAADAAAVRDDAAAMAEQLSATGRAVAAHIAEGGEVQAFLEWARMDGYVPLGYAYRAVDAAAGDASFGLRDRKGVFRDAAHPVYGVCLANIPGDADSLSVRSEALSVVKADVVGTLHRDDSLDVIGVRDVGPDGTILGEHCFVGLL